MNTRQVEVLLDLLLAQRRRLTSDERVDMWAVRIAQWRVTILNPCALVSTLPQYVNCGVFRSHRIVDCFVRAYAIWIAPEPMPFSVYARLARRRMCNELFDIEGLEDVELNDWIQDMHNRELVIRFRSGWRPFLTDEDNAGSGWRPALADEDYAEE